MLFVLVMLLLVPQPACIPVVVEVRMRREFHATAIRSLTSICPAEKNGEGSKEGRGCVRVVLFRSVLVCGLCSRVGCVVMSRLVSTLNTHTPPPPHEHRHRHRHRHTHTPATRGGKAKLSPSSHPSFSPPQLTHLPVTYDPLVSVSSIVEAPAERQKRLHNCLPPARCSKLRRAGGVWCVNTGADEGDVWVVGCMSGRDTTTENRQTDRQTDTHTHTHTNTHTQTDR